MGFFYRIQTVVDCIKNSIGKKKSCFDVNLDLPWAKPFSLNQEPENQIKINFKDYEEELLLINKINTSSGDLLHGLEPGASLGYVKQK